MTILFKDDWLKPEYTGAIADFQTRNKSFVRFAALLDSIGVSNSLFPLQLHNPNLQGVDPHSPDLTLEQMAMIGLEVKSNIFFSLGNVSEYQVAL